MPVDEQDAPEAVACERPHHVIDDLHERLRSQRDRPREPEVVARIAVPQRRRSEHACFLRRILRQRNRNVAVEPERPGRAMLLRRPERHQDRVAGAQVAGDFFPRELVQPDGRQVASQSSSRRVHRLGEA